MITDTASSARLRTESLLRQSSVTEPDGLKLTQLSIPEMHCGGCIKKIENALIAISSVKWVRANLSTRRVSVRWRAEDGTPNFTDALKAAGFDAHFFNATDTKNDDAQALELSQSLAVAGFAAANIMMLSMGVWFGADPELRGILHWISAALALATLTYSGRVFYRSAARALWQKTTNMDVPISVGLALTFSLSLYDTIAGYEHVYFDAAATLLFFLLIGRKLDHMMRRKARTAVNGLEALYADSANILQPDGAFKSLSIDVIEPGMTMLIATGERVATDGELRTGVSEIDASIVTGESAPQSVVAGDRLVAGMVNIGAPIEVVVTAPARESFIAQMIELMEVAESGGNRFRTLADRVAGYYTPVVHLAAALAFGAWMLIGGDFHKSISVAVSVLIITCPCALALAVPMVHVAASRRLFESGVFLKSGAALERMGQIDTVLLDKTGTLTDGSPGVVMANAKDDASHVIARCLASHSTHPFSIAIARHFNAIRGEECIPADAVVEYPGNGVEAQTRQGLYRLGNATWARALNDHDDDVTRSAHSYLTRDGLTLASYAFSDRILASAKPSVGWLRRRGYDVQILSGDQPDRVETVAIATGVGNYFAQQNPEAKFRYVETLQNAGKAVLMVGDGLNDIAALSAAHVSMTPSHAADIGRSQADFVFLHRDVGSICNALAISKQADALTKQNVALAIIYNLIAVPIAFAGLVTPLIAAIAMSSSSILVVANSLRIKSQTGALSPNIAPQNGSLRMANA